MHPSQGQVTAMYLYVMCLCTLPYEYQALMGSEQDGCHAPAHAALDWQSGFKLLHAVSVVLLHWQPV